MIRVYLDWNVFQDLKKNTTSSSFYQKLIASKTSIDYYFSEGLIADLKNDKSGDLERRKMELEVVSTIVGDNLLNVNKTGDFSLLKRSPVKAYETYNESKNDLLEFYDELLSGIKEDVSEKELKVLKTSFEGDVPEFVIPIKSEGEERLPKRELISKNSNKNLLEQLRDFLIAGLELGKSNDNFKAMRRSLINNDSPKITDKDFFEKIKNTRDEVFFNKLKKEWEETKDRKSTFIKGYLHLNYNNLDNESNKNAKYVNTNNDAVHAFYGGFCDIIVTQEKSMRTKTEFLYSFFKIESKVLSVHEFKFFLETNEVNLIKDMQSFYDILFKDVTSINEIIRASETDEKVMYISHLPNEIYFNYFNRFQINKEKASRVLLKRVFPNLVSTHYFFDEIFKVISNVIDVFEVDLHKKLELTNEECNDIRNNKWSGRVWLYSPISVYLKYYNGKGLILMIDLE